MCLRSRQTYNPSRYYSLDLAQRFSLEFPCGECAECRAQKQQEWFLRSYYHAKDYLDHNGWVYFDTLTYDNAHLPHISDFTDLVEKNSLYDYKCFSYEDIKGFMKRLRRELDYHGYNTKENLDYFVGSEYGSSNEYTSASGMLRKGTERPHYHILFFVKEGCNLSPMKLSYFVDKCWQKGRTDGYMYHPEDSHYVDKHTYGKAYTSDDVTLRRVTNYVSKYVLKDQHFNKRIVTKLDTLYNSLYGVEWKKNVDISKTFRSLYNRVAQFHRQSQGFGLYLIDQQEFSDIYDGFVKAPDEKLIKKKYKLPRYYETKIFKEKFKDSDGTWRWRLNSLGRERYAHKMSLNIDLLATRMQEWFYNLPQTYLTSTDKVFNPSTGKFECVSEGDCITRGNVLRDNVKQWLGDRTWKDYAVYILLYKGRVMSEAAYRRSMKSSLSYMLDRSMNVCYADQFHYRSYISKKDFDNFRTKFVCNTDLGDADHGYAYTFGSEFGEDCEETPIANIRFKSLFDILRYHGYAYTDPASFAHMMTYNEDSDPSFHDFDKIAETYKISNKYYSKRKQAAYDRKKELAKTMKSLGFYTKNV